MRIYFFCNDTATTEIYTLSLHDALPIYVRRGPAVGRRGEGGEPVVVVVGVAERDERLVLAAVVPRQPLPRHPGLHALGEEDRKSTRLNSSHANISYAVFCLKKKQLPSSF